MATLLISAAINIGVSLLISFLFPPKGQDVTQEGPRKSDLGVTSSAYGQFIHIGAGTARMGGNVIWAPIGGIEEVTNVERTESGGGKGGGGGGSVTSTTYAYFASFALAFAEGPAEDVLRIWADGKLIFDKTGSGLATDQGLTFRFYPGDEEQLPDSLIEADRGAGNVSGHRGLCYLVAERWPLANYGNRIPQLTAEIAFLSQTTAPFTSLIELSGADIIGSTSGAETQAHMLLDPFSDQLFMFKDSTTGISRSSIASMTMTAQSADSGGLFGRGFTYGMNGIIYSQETGANSLPFKRRDPVSMQVLGDTGLNIGNGSFMGVLRFEPPGLDAVDLIAVSFEGFTDGGIRIYQEEDGAWTLKLDALASADIGRGGPVIQDYFNKRLFITQENNTTMDLYEVKAVLDIGTFGPSVSPDLQLLASYTKSGGDIVGTADTTGWCILPEEEAMILSNEQCMIKVDMDTGAILATNSTLGFASMNNWSHNGKFAFGDGNSGSGIGNIIYIIDTDSLEVTATQAIGDSDFPDAIESNYPRQAYDPRNHSLIFSRVDATNPATSRVVKVQLERGTGLGIGLDLIVADICARAGLETDEYDVSDLASLIVRGYVITRQGSARSSLEPLQRGFLFEGVESDWKIKFVRRGGAPVLTIAEDDIGRLTSDAEEFVKEVRLQEVELPGRMSVLYIDKEADYQQGYQEDRRVSNPNPTQYAQNNVELDLPIVLVAEEARQLAQRWLYTSWAERLTMSTTIPWRYLRLDPTDVVNMTFRGETRQLRLSELEVGANLDIDLKGTQEDSRSNDSDLAAQGGLGHTAQIIPSGFPSRLHLLDLPLLTAVDASLQQFSRAYWAASGYDDTWPGAQLFQTRDSGASWQEIGSAPVETAWGYVSGTLADPETTATWDESSTVDIEVARGIDRFVSSTDSDVVNGANALAVLRTDGEVEIIQFVNVTVVDAGTVRLSRLLRGRRGTEPNATNHAISEQVVMLEAGATMTFQLALNLISVVTQFRGVTLGTHLEDAVQRSFAYTGQDLVPYSVVHLDAVDSSGDVVLTWTRRTRYNGELVDGTGTVPLNESSEAYEIDVVDDLGEVLNTYDAVTPTFTYTTAQQTTDGVMSTDDVVFRVYQMSGVRGRGREASVEYTIP